MSNFAVGPKAPPRFEGEFQITAVEPYKANAAEQAYIDAVTQALDVMAADEDRDAKAGIPDDLLKSRRAMRKTIAGEMMADANRFADGTQTADNARLAAAASLDKYKTTVPRFCVQDKKPSLYDEFDVVTLPSVPPSPAERIYIDALHKVFEELAADEKAEPTGGFSQAEREQRLTRRKETSAQLHKQAEKFCAGSSPAPVATEKTLIIKGGYRALRDRMRKKLFNAGVIRQEDEHKDLNKLAVDLQIGLRGGLPAPEDAASPDKQDLFVQINKAGTIIRTVCQRTIEGQTIWWTDEKRVPEKSVVERALRVQDEYMGKLHGIAVVGLEGGQTALAKLALNEVKAEFAARVGSRIKSKYARALAAWAGIVTVVLMLALSAIEWKHPEWKWAYDHRPFLFAGVGAAIGGWLSFSIRQVEFAFEDLLLLEDDPADPPLRMMFVIVLTWTLLLLLWTGAINVEVGSLQTKADALRLSGAIAVLIGIFCGLSERALATAISGRANAFVKGVAGSS